ncbi:efflux RND transporter periplasmic adaptor subunit [Pedobacter sp. N36a]|uniref:efflux RND transporter periplasmic adaptor subunit n=1 Tax=Pedobacter sp. N36a TaxID=2767996 RepID=UPI001656DD2B|nr:efflux RND transporter periplasmic adaptor subunit [Pedobacter sp. N36a]MBC8984862.1 efflux RND transporter periplasmic adaptor subunit [Pedobacter sp. N36a]
MRYTIQSLLLLPAFMILSSCGNSGSKPGGPGAGAPQVKEYKVLELQPRSATLNTDYPASIQGQQNIEIRPRVDGYVEKIFVDEGSVVRKGQPLFKINAPQYEQEVRTATASIKSAEAELSSANMAVNKVKPLVEKDIVSKYELESAQYTYQAKLAALAQAKAALSNAKTNLGYTTVTSPVDGVVGAIPFRLGSLVSGNNAEPLTTVSSTGNVYAYFAFNEKLLLHFFKDDKGMTLAQKLAKLPEVSLILSDGTLYDHKGRIQTITGQINTATGSANVRASFPNPKGLIRSGSSATVRIPDAITDAIVVPQSATYELQDKRFAVVVDKDGKTKSTAITVMKNTAGTYFVVEEGLKAGDKIVLEGVGTLKDDTQIKVTPVGADVVYADLK